MNDCEWKCECCGGILPSRPVPRGMVRVYCDSCDGCDCDVCNRCKNHCTCTKCPTCDGCGKVEGGG